MLAAGDFETAVREWLDGHAISWTRAKTTLDFFKNNLEKADAALMHFDLTQIQDCLDQLMNAKNWPFLHRPDADEVQLKKINDCHEKCCAWSAAFHEARGERVPRIFARHRIILHAFAGRRRLGDLQFYLEQDIPKDANSCFD